VGEPLCFEFALPGGFGMQDAVARVLTAWADAGAVVDIDVVGRRGHTQIRVGCARGSVTLDEALSRRA
jgi:hypothetical protein